MRLIAAATVSVVLCLPSLAQEEIPYLDDRSTPQQLVLSFYNAITRYEHARAHSYLGPYVAPDYDSFLSDYEDVRGATVTFGELTGDARAAEIFFNLPARVGLTSSSGSDRLQQGCIRITWPLPAHAEPPFEPMRISAMVMDAVAPGEPPPVCD